MFILYAERLVLIIIMFVLNLGMLLRLTLFKKRALSKRTHIISNILMLAAMVLFLLPYIRGAIFAPNSTFLAAIFGASLGVLLRLLLLKERVP